MFSTDDELNLSAKEQALIDRLERKKKPMSDTFLLVRKIQALAIDNGFVPPPSNDRRELGCAKRILQSTESLPQFANKVNGERVELIMEIVRHAAFSPQLRWCVRSVMNAFAGWKKMVSRHAEDIYWPAVNRSRQIERAKEAKAGDRRRIEEANARMRLRKAQQEAEATKTAATWD